MTISELKEYIYTENKVEFILEQIGCHSIKYHEIKKYYSCGNYNGDNKSAVTVKNNEYLQVRNYTRNTEFYEKSDIITLVQYNKQYTIYEAIKYLHELLGLVYEYITRKTKEEKIDYLSVFTKIRNKRRAINVAEIESISEEVLLDFVPYIHIKWFQEGIVKPTREKFQLGYSFRRQRCIIPIRYWATGELIGIVGRTMVENAKLFDIPKYLAIRPYIKTQNLYGLWENKEEIKKKGYIVVVEAEKSVLKRHGRLDGTCVAVGCHEISDEQVRILIGLNVHEIIISFDKDISVEHIRHTCEKFYRIRRVSYIIDKWNLLGEKEAPADAPNKIYQFMFKHRVKYDEKEHGLYLKSLKK